MPSNETSRYLEVLLVENNQPINLSHCQVEIIPSQESVEILKDRMGTILIKILDSMNKDSKLQLIFINRNCCELQRALRLNLRKKKRL